MRVCRARVGMHDEKSNCLRLYRRIKMPDEVSKLLDRNQLAFCYQLGAEATMNLCMSEQDDWFEQVAEKYGHFILLPPSVQQWLIDNGFIKFMQKELRRTDETRSGLRFRTAKRVAEDRS